MIVMLTFKFMDEVVLWCYHSNEPLWLDFLIVLFLSFDVTICNLCEFVLQQLLGVQKLPAC